jgi:hypothetical protein
MAACTFPPARRSRPTCSRRRRATLAAVAHLTIEQRGDLMAVLELLRRYAGQLDYPPGDVRGPLDRGTWGLNLEQLRHELALGRHVQFDCSQMVQQVFRWADLKDPCGLGFRYAGDTGAMLAHLPHYTDPRGAGRGALVIYGPGRGDHVSVVIEPGRDPLLASHGRKGFDVWHLSQQRSWHRPPVTLLNVSNLG